MLNFYEELAGHGMVTGVGSATMRKQKKTKIQNPIIRNINYKKTKDLPKTWGFNREKFEDFRQKRAKTFFSIFQKTQWNTRTLKTSIEHGPPKQ